MSYRLIKDLVTLVELYRQSTEMSEVDDMQTFLQWALNQEESTSESQEPNWLGKELGRSPESVINTCLVHLYRYARQHAKEAIIDSDFTTSDDLFYLITLSAHGNMTKTALIKHNVHDKSVGIQIINRLIAGDFVEQSDAANDKRNKIIQITEKGRAALDIHIKNMRQASKKVTEPLTRSEKLELIKLLVKLEDFHQQNRSTFP